MLSITMFCYDFWMDRYKTTLNHASFIFSFNREMHKSPVTNHCGAKSIDKLSIEKRN